MTCALHTSSNIFPVGLVSVKKIIVDIPPLVVLSTRPEGRDTQINYIDSYDYKVVVNIKIILQSS